MERAEKKNDRFEHKTEQDSTIVYGKNAVTELLKSGAAVDTVFVQDTMNAAQAGYYTAIAREAGAVVKRVHAAKLRGMCGTEGHQGVAAWAASVDYVSLDDLLAEAARRGEPPFLLLADGVEDPHNLGAIIRTALLCGAHGVVIPRRGGVPVTPTVLKSSAGAAARLPVARVANIGEAVRRLKAQNVFVYCADMDGRPAFQQNLTGPIALVAGSEGSGVSPLVKSLCDGVLSLPMAGGGTGGVSTCRSPPALFCMRLCASAERRVLFERSETAYHSFRARPYPRAGAEEAGGRARGSPSGTEFGCGPGRHFIRTGRRDRKKARSGRANLAAGA